MTQPLLSIEGLQVRFGDDPPAVHDASLAVCPGQTIAVVGESGSGKSTTAAAVLGLLAPGGRVTNGRITFDGHDITHADRRQLQAIRGRQIGYVPQDPMTNLNPVWTIGFQIREALRANGIADRRGARKKTVELLDAAGITDSVLRAGHYPHQLSGGMCQRALIAIGLAGRPRLLIADEPTSALDVTVQLQVLAILDELVSRRGMGLILVSHDLRLVSTFCDRILVMYGGRIVEEVEAGNLAAAKHPYTRGLVECLPRLGEDRHPLPTLDRRPEWAE
jgi:peptide/nickel transport system ATP-binding protein